MNKTELNLIEDTVDLKILSNINGKRNITDLSQSTGYTYKSVFHRIKRLQSQGIVKLTKSKDITEGAVLTISPDFNKRIAHEIRRYLFAEKELNEFYKDKEVLKGVLELLNFIESNRFVCDTDVSSFIWTKFYKEGNNPLMLKIKSAYDFLISSGRLRSRIEITRSGKQFLKDNKTWFCEFENIEEVKLWMIDNQKGRRNLTDGWKFELAQRKKEILLKKGKETQGMRTDILSTIDKKLETHNTQKEISKELGW